MGDRVMTRNKRQRVVASAHTRVKTSVVDVTINEAPLRCVRETVDASVGMTSELLERLRNAFLFLWINL